jgi:hypothetical protein
MGLLGMVFGDLLWFASWYSYDRHMCIYIYISIYIYVCVCAHLYLEMVLFGITYFDFRVSSM